MCKENNESLILEDEVDLEIVKAELQYHFSGKWYDAKDVLVQLMEKYFGER